MPYREVEKPNALQQDAIYTESIEKENRFIRLVDEYILTPGAVANVVYSTKPNNKACSEGEAKFDEDYLKSVKAKETHIRLKQTMPMTCSQEYGWDLRCSVQRVTDPRFHHPRVTTEIQQYGISIPTKKTEAS